MQSYQVKSREALLANSIQAQNYNPETHSQAHPNSRVAEKLRKAKKEKRKLYGENADSQNEDKQISKELEGSII